MAKRTVEKKTEPGARGEPPPAPRRRVVDRRVDAPPRAKSRNRRTPPPAGSASVSCSSPWSTRRGASTTTAAIRASASSFAIRRLPRRAAATAAGRIRARSRSSRRPRQLRDGDGRRRTRRMSTGGRGWRAGRGRREAPRARRRGPREGGWREKKTVANVENRRGAREISTRASSERASDARGGASGGCLTRVSAGREGDARANPASRPSKRPRREMPGIKGSPEPSRSRRDRGNLSLPPRVNGKRAGASRDSIRTFVRRGRGLLVTEVVPLLRRRADRARQHARAARALVAFHVPFVRPLVVVEMPRVAMPRARVSLLSTTPRRLATLATPLSLYRTPRANAAARRRLSFPSRFRAA